MPGKVVVGYLDTERGRDALALGSILAKARGSELGVVTVEEGERLAVAAREEDADLVVLGSSCRGLVGRIVPGATMEDLLGEAPCAVAIAPPGFGDHDDGDPAWHPLDGADEDTGMRVVGVGYDGSRASHHALEVATDLALHNGAALRVYTVARQSASIAPDAPMTPTPLATTELETKRAALYKAVAGLPTDVRALPVLLRGFAADELVKAADLGVDLLVVGTRAGGHVRRLLHKSVAGEVTIRATCPVLICPMSVPASVTAPA